MTRSASQFEPRIDHLSAVANFRARIGLALERRVVLLAPTRRLRFALATEAIERFAGDRPVRVLDAGCGDGLLSESLARRNPNWEIVGIDRNSEMLDRGRLRLERAGIENVVFEEADLTQDFGTAVYDVVTAIECLSEIPEDTQALANMAAALRPGGLFVAEVPEETWEPVLPWSARTWRYEVRHGYRPSEFRDQLAADGLVLDELYATSRGLVQLAQDVSDSIKARPVWLRSLAFPVMVSAVQLERRGITAGKGRALFVTARRAAVDQAG